MSIAGSHPLLAVGRRPNTDDLGLDRAGVAVDARGFITVAIYGAYATMRSFPVRDSPSSRLAATILKSL
jgi:hypothetical protein